MVNRLKKSVIDQNTNPSPDPSYGQAAVSKTRFQSKRTIQQTKQFFFDLPQNIQTITRDIHNRTQELLGKRARSRYKQRQMSPSQKKVLLKKLGFYQI